MKTKTYLKFSISVTISLYFIAYAIKTFVLFRFTDPFEWIKLIPEMQPDNRGLLLIGYVAYEAIKFAIYDTYEIFKKIVECNNFFKTKKK